MSSRRASMSCLLALWALAGCSRWPSFENNDNGSRETAASIAPSDWRQVAIDPAGDVDFYSLRVTAGHTYRFTCVPETLGACRVELVSPEGAVGMVAEPPYVVGGKRGYTAVASALAGVDATWYVAVTAGEDGAPDITGTYRYRLEELGPDDHADTFETATALNPDGEEGLATSGGRADVDVFSFTSEAGRAYRFECRGSTWRPHCQPVVLDPRGQPAPDLKPWGFKVPAAGTWYIARRSEDSTRTEAPEAYWYALVPVGADDHGDNAATATPFSLPGAVEGTFEFTSDRDFFFLTGRANQIFHLKPNSRCYGILDIWDPLGRKVPLSPVYDGTTRNDSFGALRLDGRYVIGLSANGWECTYSFLLEDFGTDDAGETPQTAAPLGVGGVIGHIIPFGDIDYFRMEMEAGRVYRVRCVGNNGWWYATCAVAFEAATPVVSTDDTLNNFDRLVRVKSAVNQTVMVRLSGMWDRMFEYRLEVTELGMDDHGDTPATASALVVGSDTSGVHELEGDRDDFSATLEAGRTYTVSFQPPGVQPVPALYLYPPGASTRTPVTPPYSFTAASGVYTFELESGTKDTLSYLLRVEPR